MASKQDDGEDPQGAFLLWRKLWGSTIVKAWRTAGDIPNMLLIFIPRLTLSYIVVAVGQMGRAIARPICPTATTMYDSVRRGMKMRSMLGMSPAVRQALTMVEPQSLRQSRKAPCGSSPSSCLDAIGVCSCDP